MSREAWGYISLLKLENKTTRMRVENRLNMQLHTVSARYIHFSDDSLLMSMTICNFTCQYHILHDIEEYSELLANLRYIIVF